MEKLDPAATNSTHISEYQFALYAAGIFIGTIIIVIVLVIRVHQVTFCADYDSIHHCHASLKQNA